MISRALNLQSKEMVVTVGAGGKTTIINKLALELFQTGKKVGIITTTKIYVPNFKQQEVLLEKDWQDLALLQAKVAGVNKIFVLGKTLEHNQKISGLAEKQVNKIQGLNIFDYILVEGDGAKNKLFKAPRSYEPVIPQGTTVVVPVVGIDSVGQVLKEEYFHCIEEMKMLTGRKNEEKLTVSDLAIILLAQAGYKKNVPPQARWIPFINKIETVQNKKDAGELAAYLINAGTEEIIIGAAYKKEPVLLRYVKGRWE